MFAGNLATGHAAADPGGDGNGIIFADHGETVQVTYIDANPAATLTARTMAAPGHNGAVQLSAPVNPGSTLAMQVDDLDLTAGTITVNLLNQTTGESETVTMFQSPVAGQYIGSLPSSTDAADAGADTGTLVVAVNDVLVVTYIDAIAEDGSLDVERTDQVTVEALASDGGGGGGGGGGCSMAHGGGVNPTMPALLIAILGFGWLRYRCRSTSGLPVRRLTR